MLWPLVFLVLTLLLGWRVNCRVGFFDFAFLLWCSAAYLLEPSIQRKKRSLNSRFVSFFDEFSLEVWCDFATDGRDVTSRCGLAEEYCEDDDSAEEVS